MYKAYNRRMIVINTILNSIALAAIYAIYTVTTTLI